MKENHGRTSCIESESSHSPTRPTRRWPPAKASPAGGRPTRKGDSKVGGVITFRFGERGGFDMKVLELEPGKRVLWQVVDGPAEWIGTKVSFDLKAGRRLRASSVQAQRLAGAGRVHAPLQHQVGDIPDEPEVAGRDRQGRPVPERHSRSTTGTEAASPFAFRRRDMSKALHRWMRLRRDPL